MTRPRRDSWWVHAVLVVLLAGYALLPLGETALYLLYDATAVLAMASGFCGGAGASACASARLGAAVGGLQRVGGR